MLPLADFTHPSTCPPPCRYELFEEAFEIYKKFGLKQQAIKVVLDHMEDLDRAHEFATKVGGLTGGCNSSSTRQQRPAATAGAGAS